MTPLESWLLLGAVLIASALVAWLIVLLDRYLDSH